MAAAACLASHAASLALMPVVFLNHVTPSLLFDKRVMPIFEGADKDSALAGYYRSLPSLLPSTPTAVLAISAHWEADVLTLQSSDAPPTYHDYHGFPACAYDVRYPSPGQCSRGGIFAFFYFVKSFVPLKLMYDRASHRRCSHSSPVGLSGC